jgi:hypothetical protein
LSIRGEYWIVDGRPWYADGEFGDYDHTAFAFQSIRAHILDVFGWDGEIDYLGDFSMFRQALEDTIGTSCMAEVLGKLQRECLDPRTSIELLPAAFCLSEPREGVMKYFGWKWMKKHWIATHTLTRDDMQQIGRGVEEILEEEGIEPDIDEEIEIRVASTNKSQFISIVELLRQETFCGTPTFPGFYSPEPGMGVALVMDRKSQHPCYKQVGD